MPVMLLLPFFPLATVLMSGICILASDVKCCTRVECADIVQDTLDGDVNWCYENGGFACCCCCCCRCCRHDDDDDPNTYYDDSSDSFHRHVYSKKS
jgi:hypothetical protein